MANSPPLDSAAVTRLIRFRSVLRILTAQGEPIDGHRRLGLDGGGSVEVGGRESWLTGAPFLIGSLLPAKSCCQSAHTGCTSYSQVTHLSTGAR
ncbi:uncharacterized [Tachysurus ichikawai]